jgi:serine/threonine protein kinase/Flp pilus assembly protein TadD
MPGLFHLLRCVGRAVVKNGGKALCSLVPFGEVAFEIARDAYEDYRKDLTEADLRAELESLAQASQAEVRQAAEAVAAQEAADQPAAVRQTLAAYLNQLPASIRQSLRRPSDPGGTTVPAGLSLRKPEDLLPLLPAGLPRFKPGDRPLAADWELVELLGKGGFGEVWKARHLTRSRQKPVALKFCLDPVAAATLRNEVALHNQLDRVREEAAVPGIVPLLETYLHADPPCLMYEYIEGGDLAGLVQEMHSQNRLTPEFAIWIVEWLACIMAAAHRLDPPLVHRDLKLSNVLVRGEESYVTNLFVADFGIGGLAAGQALRAQASRRMPSSWLLPTAIRGAYTPLYASPQQIRGERPDPRDDVHALGVIWYQLLTGDLKLLSIPPDWREVVEERGLGAECVRLLAACIASRAEKRPADAADLAEKLVGCQPGVQQMIREWTSPTLRALASHPMGRKILLKFKAQVKENLRQKQARLRQLSQRAQPTMPTSPPPDNSSMSPETSSPGDLPESPSPEAGPALVPTEHACPTCGKPMIQRMGERGPFLDCSGYPDCKTTMELDAEGKPVRPPLLQKLYEAAKRMHKLKLQMRQAFNPATLPQGPDQSPVPYPEAPPVGPELPELGPDDALLHFNRGNAQFENGDYDNAIKDLSEAVRLDPENARAYRVRGLAWDRKKDYDKAINDFDEAVRLDPNDAVAFFNRAGAWWAKRDDYRAISDYNESIRLNPNHARAFFERGSFWENQEDYGRALKDFEEALRLNPRDEFAHLRLAFLLATCPDDKIRDGKRAIEMATKVCELTDDWNTHWKLMGLAAAYAEAGQFDEAVRYQEKALEDQVYQGPGGDAFRQRLELYKQRKPYRHYH